MSPVIQALDLNVRRRVIHGVLTPLDSSKMLKP
jgi:hypothetical protein